MPAASPAESSPHGESLADRVAAAVAAVDDPELPGISVVDLGLVESLDVTADGAVTIGLVPTFSGCPALGAILADVTDAVASVPGATVASVSFLTSPVWTVDRIGERARRRLVDGLGVTVQLGDRPPPCPRCGAPTTLVSAFGATRCRAVRRCDGCGELVEVMRS